MGGPAARDRRLAASRSATRQARPARDPPRESIKLMCLSVSATRAHRRRKRPCTPRPRAGRGPAAPRSPLRRRPRQAARPSRRTIVMAQDRAQEAGHGAGHGAGRGARGGWQRFVTDGAGGGRPCSAWRRGRGSGSRAPWTGQACRNKRAQQRRVAVKLLLKSCHVVSF